MNKAIAIIICVIVIALVLFFSLGGKNNKLIAPGFTGQTKTSVTIAPTPTLSPPVAPQTFKFDRSTDLKQELEKVNPQVLDSDFQ